MQPTVLTIAGSDSSGGAGIQADLKAIAANGGYGASVITAITAQNTRGVFRAEALSVDLIRAQIDAVFSDLHVAAVKTGMLASEAIIEVVAEGIRQHAPSRYVCDPVMISKTGFPLLPEACGAKLAATLLPLAQLITPNLREAERLAGISVSSLEEATEAGRRILGFGASAVLVKGGHLRNSPGTDVLVTDDGSRLFETEWVDSRHTHGTGCTYSAAIATQLARGLPLDSAIVIAKEFVTRAIRAGIPVGHGTGPTDPFFFLRDDGESRWIDRLEGRIDHDG